MSTKRIYDEPGPDDGFRVLVDRLWPRGVSKQVAKLDEWLKDVGPSTQLRTWFHHDAAQFDQFERRYRAELETNPAVDRLREIIASHPKVTLLYGARDNEHNQAVVLRDFLAQ